MSLWEHRLWFRKKAASRPDYLQCTAPAAAAMQEPEEETDQMFMLCSTVQSTEHSRPEHATILLFKYEKPFYATTLQRGFILDVILKCVNVMSNCFGAEDTWAPLVPSPPVWGNNKYISYCSINVYSGSDL